MDLHSQLILRSAWLLEAEQMCRCSGAGLRMNMERARLAALAASFPTETQIFSQFFAPPKDEGRWGRTKG